MDLAGTDPNGFIITRDSEGLEHSAIPWDDPYPFFRGMIPKHEKASKEEFMSTPSEERSGKGQPGVRSIQTVFMDNNSLMREKVNSLFLNLIF